VRVDLAAPRLERIKTLTFFLDYGFLMRHLGENRQRHSLHQVARKRQGDIELNVNALRSNRRKFALSALGTQRAFAMVSLSWERYARSVGVKRTAPSQPTFQRDTERFCVDS
jgi:hypothetical protein